MLNDALDWDALRQSYNKNKRILIRNVLESDFAEKVFHCLSVDVAWELYYLTEKGPTILSADKLNSITPEQQAAIWQKLTEISSKGFSYFYFRHVINNASHPILKEYYNFLAGPKVLEFIKHVSGDQALDRMNVVATKYTPSSFLRTHNDYHVEHGRRVGHLWGLTRNWDPDWGGTLQFLDKDRSIIENYTPEFNTLTLFKVPVTHFVSQVAAYANVPRFVFSGWFHNKPYLDEQSKKFDI